MLLEVDLQKDQQGWKVDPASATIYNPWQSFQIGEAIFHREWNDVGKVVSKIRTSDGSHAIIVAFEKQGERRLLESLKPEPSTVLEN